MINLTLTNQSFRLFHRKQITDDFRCTVFKAKKIDFTDQFQDKNLLQVICAIF